MTHRQDKMMDLPATDQCGTPRHHQRRHLVGVMAGSLVLGPGMLLPLQPVAAQPEGVSAIALGGAEPPRLALLIGNRDYPDGQDLPPVHKNVRDLKAALGRRGFEVTDLLDQDVHGARDAVAQFSQRLRAMPPDTTVFFYYSGHGAQVDAKNVLIPARLSPKSSSDRLLDGSLVLARDVVAHLARRPRGLTMAVIDACRTSLRPAPGVSTGPEGGLNQVEAPPGCLIAFATGAGRPAIAPIDERRNTFYTASLVRLLDAAPGELTFSELFRLVKMDVHETMLNHPIAVLRQFAQLPFIAENTQVMRRLAPRDAAEEAEGGRTAQPAEEQAVWDEVELALWPGEVARLAAAFIQRFPGGSLAARALVAQRGAKDAAQILTRREVRLYRSAFAPVVGMPPELVADLAKAGRGDKDAAARLGRWHFRLPAERRSRTDIGRYEGWMQFAAALGNGIASYELALYYRQLDQPQLAAQYEARALELGYTPPPSLDNSRK
ncbi:MAG: hypothetical protein RL722_117 [Pseudomonadota bacterium]|jgi:hypothetical protein